jgi:hypothetical protein
MLEPLPALRSASCTMLPDIVPPIASPRQRRVSLVMPPGSSASCSSGSNAIVPRMDRGFPGSPRALLAPGQETKTQNEDAEAEVDGGSSFSLFGNKFLKKLKGARGAR